MRGERWGDERVACVGIARKVRRFAGERHFERQLFELHGKVDALHVDIVWDEDGDRGNRSKCRGGIPAATSLSATGWAASDGGADMSRQLDILLGGTGAVVVHRGDGQSGAGLADFAIVGIKNGGEFEAFAGETPR